MGPIKAVALCYARLFNFRGRARRAEYWWFFLWQVLAGGGAGVVLAWLAASRARTDPAFAMMLQDPAAVELYVGGLIAPYAFHASFAYLVLVILPNLAVTIRRLHDTDRSGWNIFMPTLVSIASGIGGVVLMGGSAATGSTGGAILGMAVMIVPSTLASVVFLVWLCLPSSNGPNRFGADPIKNRKAPEPAHPAFAAALDGEARDRAEIARKAAAHDYYKRRVLPSIQKA